MDRTNNETSETSVRTATDYEKVSRRLGHQVGTSIETIAETINTALSAFVTESSFAVVKQLLMPVVNDHLRHIGTTRVQPPPARIVGPIFESIRCCRGDPFLVGLLGKLLATSMDPRIREKAHPAFVNLVMQLTAVDVRVLSVFRRQDSYPVIWFYTSTCSEMYSHIAECAGITNIDSFTISIDNLTRLDLLSFVVPHRGFSDKVKKLAEEPATIARKDRIAECRQETVKISRAECSVNRLGKMFIEACLP